MEEEIKIFMALIKICKELSIDNEKLLEGNFKYHVTFQRDGNKFDFVNSSLTRTYSSKGKLTIVDDFEVNK